MPILSIIIVSYNVKDLLTDCLESVFAAGNSLEMEVLVVDNASKDGTVEQIQHRFPSTRLMVNDQNVGFPRANNQALAACSGEIILLLNPDTLVHQNTFIELLRFFKGREEGVVAGLNVRNGDGSFQRCIHKLPDVKTVLLSPFDFDSRFPKSRFFNSWGYVGIEPTRVQTVGYVSGAGLALNRKALQVIGGLDEDLFWNEDVDFCCRAWQAGIPVYFLPQCRMTHFVGASAKSNMRRVIYHRMVSRIRYVRKHFSKPSSEMAIGLTLLEICSKIMLNAAKLLAPSKYSECRSRLAGYFDALDFIIRKRRKDFS